MDSTALHELIAQVRGTTAALSAATPDLVIDATTPEQPRLAWSVDVLVEDAVTPGAIPSGFCRATSWSSNWSSARPGRGLAHTVGR